MSFHPVRANRRGVALPLALFTLVIAAVMITAVFWVARLEQRMGYNSVASTQAFEAAEAGLSSVITGWTPSVYNSMASGATITLPTSTVGGNSTYTASIRRLNTTLFLVTAEGRYLVNGLAVTRRQVGRVVRLDPPYISPDAALVTRTGLLDVRDNATISGNDSVPPGWGPVCPPPGPMSEAILDSASTITTSGPCFGQSCLIGTPKIEYDSIQASTNGFRNFGPTSSFDELAGGAEKEAEDNPGATFLPGSPPTCNIADEHNWGEPLDPTGPCGEYMPVIYAPGNFTLSIGRGQGILLVQGNFRLAGTAEFTGIIIVRGSITIDGGHVVGVLMTENELGSPAYVGGTATLAFSRCAIRRAVAGAAQPSAVQGRSWIQLY